MDSNTNANANTAITRPGQLALFPFMVILRAIVVDFMTSTHGNITRSILTLTRLFRGEERRLYQRALNHVLGGHIDFDMTNLIAPERRPNIVALEHNTFTVWNILDIVREAFHVLRFHMVIDGNPSYNMDVDNDLYQATIVGIMAYHRRHNIPAMHEEYCEL